MPDDTANKISIAKIIVETAFIFVPLSYGFLTQHSIVCVTALGHFQPVTILSAQ
jgi:hypothetical protein